jgi:magnesium-transporting ATPase (P-type)
VALSDLPAEDVVTSLEQLREAHILLAMITGDAEATAVAVARQVGIFSKDSENVAEPHTIRTMHSKLRTAFDSDLRSVLVLGAEVDFMSSVEWDYVLAHRELVFAQTSPENKLEIVKQCEKRGHIVGVTGDGVNDCPALAAAHVGIAMSRGSDVAREVADVVLLNNSFQGIVDSVREGRLIFDNLRKTSAYLLSVSSGAQLLPLVATFFLGLPKPISLFNVVLVSCVTNLFGAVALMCETAETELMQRTPRNTVSERLVDGRLILYSFAYGSLMAVGGFFNYFAYLLLRGNDPGAILFTWWEWELWHSTPTKEDEFVTWKTVSTVYMVTIVVAQMAHLVSIRRKRPYFYSEVMGAVEGLCRCSACVSHWPTTYAILGSAIILVVFLYVPLFNAYCRTAPVSPDFWGLAVAWAVLWFVLAEVRKWVIALYPHSWVGRLAW